MAMEDNDVDLLGLFQSDPPLSSEAPCSVDAATTTTTTMNKDRTAPADNDKGAVNERRNKSKTANKRRESKGDEGMKVNTVQLGSSADKDKATGVIVTGSTSKKENSNKSSKRSKSPVAASLSRRSNDRRKPTSRAAARGTTSNGDATKESSKRSKSPMARLTSSSSRRRHSYNPTQVGPRGAATRRGGGDVHQKKMYRGRMNKPQQQQQQQQEQQQSSLWETTTPEQQKLPDQSSNPLQSSALPSLPSQSQDNRQRHAQSNQSQTQQPKHQSKQPQLQLQLQQGHRAPGKSAPWAEIKTQIRRKSRDGAEQIRKSFKGLRGSSLGDEEDAITDTMQSSNNGAGREEKERPARTSKSSTGQHYSTSIKQDDIHYFNESGHDGNNVWIIRNMLYSKSSLAHLEDMNQHHSRSPKNAEKKSKQHDGLEKTLKNSNDDTNRPIMMSNDSIHKDDNFDLELGIVISKSHHELEQFLEDDHDGDGDDQQQQLSPNSQHSHHGPTSSKISTPKNTTKEESSNTNNNGSTRDYHGAKGKERSRPHGMTRKTSNSNVLAYSDAMHAGSPIITTGSAEKTTRGSSSRPKLERQLSKSMNGSASKHDPIEQNHDYNAGISRKMPKSSSIPNGMNRLGLVSEGSNTKTTESGAAHRKTPRNMPKPSLSTLNHLGLVSEGNSKGSGIPNNDRTMPDSILKDDNNFDDRPMSSFIMKDEDKFDFERGLVTRTPRKMLKPLSTPNGMHIPGLLDRDDSNTHGLGKTTSNDDDRPMSSFIMKDDNNFDFERGLVMSRSQYELKQLDDELTPQVGSNPEHLPREHYLPTVNYNKDQEEENDKAIQTTPRDVDTVKRLLVRNDKAIRSTLREDAVTKRLLALSRSNRDMEYYNDESIHSETISTGRPSGSALREEEDATKNRRLRSNKRRLRSSSLDTSMTNLQVKAEVVQELINDNDAFTYKGARIPRRRSVQDLSSHHSRKGGYFPSSPPDEIANEATKMRIIFTGRPSRSTLREEEEEEDATKNHRLRSNKRRLRSSSLDTSLTNLHIQRAALEHITANNENDSSTCNKGTRIPRRRTTQGHLSRESIRMMQLLRKSDSSEDIHQDFSIISIGAGDNGNTWNKHLRRLSHSSREHYFEGHDDDDDDNVDDDDAFLDVEQQLEEDSKKFRRRRSEDDLLAMFSVETAITNATAERDLSELVLSEHARKSGRGKEIDINLMSSESMIITYTRKNEQDLSGRPGESSDSYARSIGGDKPAAPLKSTVRTRRSDGGGKEFNIAALDDDGGDIRPMESSDSYTRASGGNKPAGPLKSTVRTRRSDVGGKEFNIAALDDDGGDIVESISPKASESSGLKRVSTRKSEITEATADIAYSATFEPKRSSASSSPDNQDDERRDRKAKSRRLYQNTEATADNNEDSATIESKRSSNQSSSFDDQNDEERGDGKTKKSRRGVSSSTCIMCLCYCASLILVLVIGLVLGRYLLANKDTKDDETSSSSSGSFGGPDHKEGGIADHGDGQYTMPGDEESTVTQQTPPLSTTLYPSYSPSSHFSESPSISKSPAAQSNWQPSTTYASSSLAASTPPSSTAQPSALPSTTVYPSMMTPSGSPSFSPTPSKPVCPKQLLKSATLGVDGLLTMKYEVIIYGGDADDGSGGLLCISLEYEGEAGWIGLAFSEASRDPQFGRKEAVIGIPGLASAVAVATDNSSASTSLGQQNHAAVEGGPMFVNPGKYEIPAVTDGANFGPSLNLLRNIDKQTLINGTISITDPYADGGIISDQSTKRITRLSFAKYLREANEIEVDPYDLTLLLYAVAPLDDDGEYDGNPEWRHTYLKLLDGSSSSEVKSGLVRKRERQHHHGDP